MLKELKNWILGIEEKPEIKEQSNIEEVHQEIVPSDEDRIRVVGTEDPVIEELLNKVWTTGKAHIANRNADGTVTFEELDDK